MAPNNTQTPLSATAVPSLEAPGVTVIEPGTTCDAATAALSHAPDAFGQQATAEAVAPLVEHATDTDENTVVVEGRMYHDGLNANAWGMTEEGATAIAADLVGQDFTASHPYIRRGGVYDRAVSSGPGRPIGSVLDTNVTTVEQAMLDGGDYTADYIAGITDPEFAARYAAGTLTGDGYAVSVGIYGDPESAVCNICGEAFDADDHDHRRGETIVREQADGSDEELMAGPLFDDGESDHLAGVYLPAYEDATASVDTASMVAADAGHTGFKSPETAGTPTDDQSDPQRATFVATALAAEGGHFALADTDAAQPQTASESESESEADDSATHSEAADITFPVRVTPSEAADAASKSESESEVADGVSFETVLK